MNRRRLDFRSFRIFPFLTALACISDSEDRVDWISPLSADGTPSITFGSATGWDVVEVPVSLVNNYRASIPGTELTVSLTGSSARLDSNTIILDAHGQGVVRVEVDGPEAFTLSVTGSADGAEIGASVTAYGLGAPFPDFGLGTVSALDDSIEEIPHLAAEATAGVVIAVSDELWWHGLDQAIGVQFANLPGPVAGMQSTHIDADGILDLVTWTGAQILLFRGRPGGGFSWGGGWVGDSGEVAGVAAADLDSNRTTDLAIALSGNDAGIVQLLGGNGAWEFEQLGRPLDLNHGLDGIAAADESNDGRPDITVIAQGQDRMRRYTLTDDGWVGASTFDLSSNDGSECGEGSELLPMSDLDGDGRPEVTISGPPTASPHELVFFILGETITHYPLAYEPYTVDLSDMNDDGAVDITLLEEGTLHYIHFSEGNFEDDTIELDVAGGPIASGDMDGDGDGDLAIVSEGVAFTRGRLNDTGGWSRDTATWSSFATSVLTDPVVTDIDGDGIADVLGLSSSGGVITANLWRLLNDSEGVELLYVDNVSLGSSTEAYSIIECSADGYTDYYALVGDGENERIYRLKISSSEVGAYISLSTDGTHLHCADTWDGASYTPYMIVVSNDQGQWTSYRRGLTVDDEGNVAGIDDFAMMPNEFVGCSETGCSMTILDIDEDGTPELFTMDSSGLTVEWSDGGEDSVYRGSGTLSVADVDGDGYTDIVATDTTTSRVWIYRNLGNDIAPPIGLHTTRSLGSNAHFGDVSGDGVPELVMIDADGRIIHTAETEPHSASSW